MAVVGNRSDPHGRHDWHSADYVNDWIKKDVTRDEDRRPMLTRMIERIPRQRQDKIQVLDVGAGYGELTRCVLEVFPEARVICQDFSEPMHQHARERLGEFIDRVDYVKSDLSRSNWVAPFEQSQSFDAVVSSIAIHNVRFSERIRGIYQEVAQLLAPGGSFLNCDLVFDNVETHLGWLEADFEDVTLFEQEGRMTTFGGYKKPQ